MRRSRPRPLPRHGLDGCRSEKSVAPNPREKRLSSNQGAEESLIRAQEIETILSQSAASVGSTAVKAGSHLDHIPPSNHRPLGMGMEPMTADEEARLIADVYGRSTPEVALAEDRLEALEREIGRLDREERSALNKALRFHPLLTVASPHVRMVLWEDDFDPPSAARRLAGYWRQREAMFGSRAFSGGLLTQPVFDDYIRHYRRCVRAMDNPELDGEMRDMAREYVRIVNRVKVEAMDKIIENAPEMDRDALMEARRLYPEVASSYEHKILFLKAEEFVEARAAVRMMKYWAMKRLLFGQDRLGKEITLADVDSSVFESNVIGHALLVPETDEAGRNVFWITAKELNGEGWTAEGVAQYVWCILHIALSCPSCRDNGLVVMVNKGGVTTNLNRTSASRELCTSITVDCMPFRVRAMHIFFAPSPWWQSFMSGLMRKFSTFVNQRFVVHIGTREENTTVLKEQFGLGPDQVVKEVGGNVDLDSWRDWIRKRKEEGH